ncbi:hypothetical protein L873DRAFT_1820730 [Choiromyces venosus 120613-1]|uniref:Extracellular membrane protein CFEM domain-containing protein n=1 Tax=Choiromyces venosus 120613-1 TaxID=1336337 RepID=A0A3N4IWS1_9PEZI|nr:hypothetical protein L873DRAFT_1820730 [Choiromyces venosus 120613-1]
MFNKSTVFTTVVLVFGLLIRSSTAAAPPACVLACLNEQGTLTDMEKLCGSDKVGACLSSECGDSLKDAQDYFINTCKANGKTASLGSSSSSTMSGSSSSTATSSGFATLTSSGSLVTGTSTGGSPTRGSGSGSNGTVSIHTATPSATVGNSASSLNVMGGALALVVLTAGFVL